MADQKKTSGRNSPRRPYRKPEFRAEPVFETMALRCGKIDARQRQCARVKKNS